MVLWFQLTDPLFSPENSVAASPLISARRHSRYGSLPRPHPVPTRADRAPLPGPERLLPRRGAVTPPLPSLAANSCPALLPCVRAPQTNPPAWLTQRFLRGCEAKCGSRPAQPVPGVCVAEGLGRSLPAWRSQEVPSGSGSRGRFSSVSHRHRAFLAGRKGLEFGSITPGGLFQRGKSGGSCACACAARCFINSGVNE